MFIYIFRLKMHIKSRLVGALGMVLTDCCDHNNNQGALTMADQQLQGNESSLDAIAAIALIMIVVVAAVFWVSGQ